MKTLFHYSNGVESPSSSSEPGPSGIKLSGIFPSAGSELSPLGGAVDVPGLVVDEPGLIMGV